MLQENLIRMYEESFRAHRELPALTDYFKGETFSYYEMAKEIAKLHLFFKKAVWVDRSGFFAFGHLPLWQKRAETLLLKSISLFSFPFWYRFYYLFRVSTLTATDLFSGGG